jgi:flagellar motor switch protein FliG
MAGNLKILALTGIIALQSMIVTGQTVPGQNSSADVQEEAAKYERYYEVVLDNALSDYYREGTFIVDVKATLERILVPKGYQVVQPQEDIKIENLPGLPFIPPNLQSNRPTGQDSLKASGFDARFQLTRLNIKVLVDTSYSDEDVDFVEEAASLIANADEFRGDIVSVSKKVFPRNSRAIEQDIKKPTAPSPAQLIDTTTAVEEVQPEIISAVPDTVIQTVTAEPEKKMFLGIDWNNPQHLLFVILGLGILFLVALLVALLRKPKRKETLPGMYPPGYEGMNIPNMPMQGGQKEPEAPKGPSAKELARFEENKTFIANNCISKPKIVANVVSKWITEDEEQGVVKAVRSFVSVDDKLIQILRPHMDATTFEMLNYGLDNAESIPLEERIDEVESFRKSLTQYKAPTEAEGGGASLFDFVDQLTDQQLLHLMKDESDEMVSILLAQIAGERAGVILQKMDDEKRISILLKMGKINSIPISVYKKVASHFSNKALAVSDMKYVAADGIESILNTIETMPLSDQDAYVRSIAEQDLELAKKIRRFFIGFDDLPKVKNEFVQSALDEIPTETLILALRTAPAAVREKILKVRPKREQQLILSEVDNPSDASKADIEDAQKAVLYAVRRKMKTEA